MISGMSTHVQHPHHGSFHALIISEPAMASNGDWYICVTKEGKLLSVNIMYCENLS